MKKILSYFACAAIMFSFAACGGNAPEATIPGAFTVGPNKQVYFAQGNLRKATNHITMETIWSFALNQYDIIGDEPMPVARDLFSWNEINESSDFDNWTINTIANGFGYTWRVMTGEEWLHLFHGRPNYLKLFGFGNIQMENGSSIYGLFILPDSWQLPKGTIFHSAEEKGVEWVVDPEGYDYYKSQDDAREHNLYVADKTHPENDTWSVMQEAGMVFLPMTGLMSGEKYYDSEAAYWASSTVEGYACGIDFTYGSYHSNYCLCPYGWGDKIFGQAFRLVRDVK